MIGSIANNRFLQRVNPEIKRALNETGAAASMRQMVDLDIAKNLVGWWHRDNVNTRTSGSDTFVTQANDSSGGSNNAAQTTEANQPKLVSDGMEFDGSDDKLSTLNHVSSQVMTVILWIKSHSWSGNYWENVITDCHDDSGNGSAGWVIRTGNGKFNINFGSSIDGSWLDSLGVATLSLNTFYMLSAVVTQTSVNTYINTTLDINDTFSSRTFSTGTRALSIGDGAYWTGRAFDGIINNISIFNTALTSTQIAAIYNQTKGYYGL